ncbi:ATP-binding protein [Pseudonocardia humida]|uniref:ATP-binding protein n=1 Tax=Pseudonocardia humida TaxID=2800819 RepID=A0ABT1A749_9PSEU|nr:ATP-binding protein [Pseudonocardia humida]MCO1658842.1 ATP-binding protein [Pseudonocardia humida]
MTEGLRIVLRAGARSPAQARRVVSGWMARVCGRAAPCDLADDLVFAVSEAVTNCIDHAYRDRAPGEIRVEGSVSAPAGGPRAVTVAVSDDGAWVEPDHDPGFRGRGVEMIRASVSSLTMVAGRCGTTLTMTQQLGC